MKLPLPLAFVLPLSLCLSGCDQASPFGRSGSSKGSGATEHIDAEEVAAATRLKAIKDPISEEAYKFSVKVRQMYNSSRFDELEKIAAELRAEKQLFRNGSWKIVRFYDAFDCRDDEPEKMWKLHDQIHQAWIAAKPESITARVAYADFLTSYAWHARGTGYANTVADDGWRLFSERLESSKQILMKAREMPEKDPVLWLTALTVALGQGPSKSEYDALMAEAHAFEPTFWGYDGARAYSLLPRWHGEPGEWEAFAEQTAARPDGPGAEVYARIVMRLMTFHDNIFRESKASWDKTKEGLAQLRQKYPESLEFVNITALLATMAEDQELAEAMFDQLGDTYVPSVWRKPERFAHYRNWARTGKW